MNIHHPAKKLSTSTYEDRNSQPRIYQLTLELVEADFGRNTVLVAHARKQVCDPLWSSDYHANGTAFSDHNLKSIFENSLLSYYIHHILKTLSLEKKHISLLDSRVLNIIDIFSKFSLYTNMGILFSRLKIYEEKRYNYGFETKKLSFFINRLQELIYIIIYRLIRFIQEENIDYVSTSSSFDKKKRKKFSNMIDSCLYRKGPHNLSVIPIGQNSIYYHVQLAVIMLMIFKNQGHTFQIPNYIDGVPVEHLWVVLNDYNSNPSSVPCPSIFPSENLYNLQVLARRDQMSICVHNIYGCQHIECGYLHSLRLLFGITEKIYDLYFVHSSKLTYSSNLAGLHKNIMEGFSP